MLAVKTVLTGRRFIGRIWPACCWKGAPPEKARTPALGDAVEPRTHDLQADCRGAAPTARRRPTSTSAPRRWRSTVPTLMRKLHLNSAVELAPFAVDLGLVQRPACCGTCTPLQSSRRAPRAEPAPPSRRARQPLPVDAPAAQFAHPAALGGDTLVRPDRQARIRAPGHDVFPGRARAARGPGECEVDVHEPHASAPSRSLQRVAPDIERHVGEAPLTQPLARGRAAGQALRRCLGVMIQPRGAPPARHRASQLPSVQARAATAPAALMLRAARHYARKWCQQRRRDRAGLRSESAGLARESSSAMCDTSVGPTPQVYRAARRWRAVGGAFRRVRIQVWWCRLAEACGLGADVQPAVAAGIELPRAERVHRRPFRRPAPATTA